MEMNKKMVSHREGKVRVPFFSTTEHILDDKAWEMSWQKIARLE